MKEIRLITFDFFIASSALIDLFLSLHRKKQNMHITKRVEFSVFHLFSSNTHNVCKLFVFIFGDCIL